VGLLAKSSLPEAGCDVEQMINKPLSNATEILL
jgi:hypothetical protein